jgi:hypothetical protein
MTIYALVLFIHVTAVLTMFTVLSLEGLSLRNLRRACTLTEARGWLELIPGLPLIAMGSLLVVFSSGVYLAMRMSAFELAWTKVTIAALLLIAPLGALTGRRMRAIRRACSDAQAINSEILSRLRNPFLPVSLGIRIGAFLAIVLLMSAKPDLWVSIGVVGSFAVLGFLSSVLATRRAGSLPAPRARTAL